MAKPELGTKRQCLSCGAKFYDLNRDPIHCSKCGALFQVAIPRVSSTPAGKEDEEEASALGDTEAVEIVSLDDIAAHESASDSDSDDDIDLGDDEEAFLADDDEENDDVSDLIDGDISSDDEN